MYGRWISEHVRSEYVFLAWADVVEPRVEIPKNHSSTMGLRVLVHLLHLVEKLLSLGRWPTTLRCIC